MCHFLLIPVDSSIGMAAPIPTSVPHLLSPPLILAFSAAWSGCLLSASLLFHLAMKHSVASVTPQYHLPHSPWDIPLLSRPLVTTGNFLLVAEGLLVPPRHETIHRFDDCYGTALIVLRFPCFTFALFPFPAVVCGK